MVNQQLPPPRRRGDHLFERWGVKLDEDSNGIVHSGLVPMFPALLGSFGLGEDLWWTHKRALQEAATPSTPLPKSIPKPSGQQLDQLFFTEHWQQSIFYGVRTWELPSLNQGIIGTSYWQEVLMTDLSIMPLPSISVTVQEFPDIDLVNVDESKWNKAFARGRWYDLRDVILEKDANGHPSITRSWSVDDNGVWDQLRTVIEMANRILRQVIYGDWLYALLEGRTVPVPNVEPWVPGKTANFFMPRRMVSPGEEGTGLQQPDHRVAQRLWANIELLSEWVIWSFFDPRDVDKYGTTKKSGVVAGYCEHATGRTGSSTTVLDAAALPHPKDPRIFTDIKINTMLLEALLMVSNTPEEVAAKHVTRAQLALVMVHELMHALHNAKVLVKSGRSYWAYEPVYKNEDSAELGWSQEQSLQGAVTNVGPINVFMPDSDFLSRAGPAFRYACSWLTSPLAREKGHELIQSSDGSRRGMGRKLLTELDPLPTYWSSRLQSQSFWDSHVAVYGVGALKFKPVMRGYEMYHQQFHLRLYHARRCVQPSVQRHRPIMANQMQRFLLEEEQTYQYMDFRKKLWKSLRPWCKHSYRIWQKTPYSVVFLRLYIDKFRQAVAKRDRKAAENMINAYSSKLKVMAIDLATPIRRPNDPPSPEPIRLFEFNRHPALWPFTMIECMMHASLPYDWHFATRTAAAPPPPPAAAAAPKHAHPFANHEYLANRWFPSQHALAAGTFFRYPVTWHRPKDDPPPPKTGPDVTNPAEVLPPMVAMSTAKPDRPASWPTPATNPSVFGARLEMLFRIETMRVTIPMANYPIPKPLWLALTDQYKALQKQNLALGPANSNGAWLDFDFSFPPYDAENDQFVCLHEFKRPVRFQDWTRVGNSKSSWFSQGHAHPDKLTVVAKVLPNGLPGGDPPEAYYPSDYEGDGNLPEVWKHWWPIYPPPAPDPTAMDVDADVDMVDPSP